MKPENEWLFYSMAAWNVDQAAYIAKTLIDNPPDDKIYASKVVWASAYKFCIVSYCSPFMGFETSEGRNYKDCLKLSIVPLDLQATHTQVKNFRDQVLAHTDIVHLEAVGFHEGYRIASTSTHLSPPPIQESFRLFAKVGEILIQKLDTLKNED